MTERERLIELLKNDNCPSPMLCDKNCKYAELKRCYEARTADYLLANGIIVTPCMKKTKKGEIQMTDNEIIKALECCRDNNCYECETKNCTSDLLNKSIYLINRQKSEIERLKESGKEAVYRFNRVESLYKIKCKELKVAKSEAIKEFAGRLNARIRKDIDEQGMFPLPCTKKAYDTVRVFIKNLLKEMTEEKNHE